MGRLRQPKRFTGNGKYEIEDLAKDLVHPAPEYRQLPPAKAGGFRRIFSMNTFMTTVKFIMQLRGLETLLFSVNFFLDLDELSRDEWDAVLSPKGLNIELELS